MSMAKLQAKADRYIQRYADRIKFALEIPTVIHDKADKEDRDFVESEGGATRLLPIGRLVLAKRNRKGEEDSGPYNVDDNDSDTCYIEDIAPPGSQSRLDDLRAYYELTEGSEDSPFVITNEEIADRLARLYGRIPLKETA